MWNPFNMTGSAAGSAYAQARAQMKINTPVDPANIPVIPDGSGRLVQSQLYGGGQDQTKIKNVKVGNG